MEKSKKEAESARKQADKYQKRMQELAPMVKDMEHMAAKFSVNPEQVLPEAGSIESGKSYREKKAKTLMEKIVKVLRSVYASYLDVSRKYENKTLAIALRTCYAERIRAMLRAACVHPVLVPIFQEAFVSRMTWAQV